MNQSRSTCICRQKVAHTIGGVDPPSMEFQSTETKGRLQPPFHTTRQSWESDGSWRLSLTLHTQKQWGSAFQVLKQQYFYSGNMNGHMIILRTD